MKRFVSAAILYLFICHTTMAADTLRYRDVVFRQIKIDSVVYCTQGGKQLYMDVYQPTADTFGQRPLVILAHGGSFMHGDRHSDCLPTLCRQLAQRGYVVASIDYRLTNLLGMASKRRAYGSMMKAVADGRNCVRWFISDAAHGNTYHINTDRIFFGGSSAGAILAEQLGFIDSAAECSSALCRMVNKYLPDTGALPPHSIRGIISLAGAVLDTNLIGLGQPALLHIQGDADRVVPFAYKRPIYGLAPFKLAGLAGSRRRYVSQKLDYTEYVFKKMGHTPWDNDEKTLAVVVEQMVAFMNKQMK